MDNKAMYKISYGLYLLTTKDENGKDNGCIVNTVSMITDNPKRIAVFVNKSNYTESVLKKTRAFNVSVLSESAPFSIFKRFGFQSGRTVDKFENFPCPRSGNGLYYLGEHANALISAWVVDAYDYGTHTVFIAEVADCETLSSEPSMTYAYYQSNVKPKPQAAASTEKTEKWVCTVCGYVHEGPLPDDFICPWCKHPASDFEKIS